MTGTPAKRGYLSTPSPWVRMRCRPRTRAYFARRSAEGKTTREIRRCLKRYIARELYRALTASMPVIDARGIPS